MILKQHFIVAVWFGATLFSKPTALSLSKSTHAKGRWATLRITLVHFSMKMFLVIFMVMLILCYFYWLFALLKMFKFIFLFWRKANPSHYFFLYLHFEGGKNLLPCSSCPWPLKDNVCSLPTPWSLWSVSLATTSHLTNKSL